MGEKQIATIWRSIAELPAMLAVPMHIISTPQLDLLSKFEASEKKSWKGLPGHLKKLHFVATRTSQTGSAAIEVDELLRLVKATPMHILFPAFARLPSATRQELKKNASKLPPGQRKKLLLLLA
eukprot:m.220887 g.220887  ORF g.220887 m.220887 type:complete len:124 (+) comp15671_c0_seq1:1181-1552(+)